MDNQKLELYMNEALKEAEKAFKKNEVPVGAVIVYKHKIIGRGYNLTESTKDITNHAEIIAIRQAEKIFGDWRLENVYLFSTIEPCIMCVSAAILSRISTIVYGANNEKFGGCKSLVNIPEIDKINHKINIIDSILANEAKELMQKYFKKFRKNNGEMAEFG